MKSDPGAALGPDWRGEEHAGAVLTIRLDALAANWRLIRDRVAGAACAAVVKADGYGLGADKVAPALAAAGCRHFFVAQLEEGAALRMVLPEAEIYVLNGPIPGTEAFFPEHRLVPVLNHLGQVEAWQALARMRGKRQQAILHVDTGMNRLGLPAEELDILTAEPARLDGIELCYVLSHLVEAENQGNPLNRHQLARFREALDRLPPSKGCLSNGSGCFLAPEYHFDLVRPGAALYGVAPVDGARNPMAQVAHLQGRILQVRDVDRPETVGYGATHRVAGPATLATVALGYADGYLRHLSNNGHCYVEDIRVPVVGRVSMDLITLDVSEVPAPMRRPGRTVEILGENSTVDDVAREAGTIGYEILTALGDRYHRRYVGGPSA